jgi:ABC-type transport system substrate-binding protein
MTAGLDGDTSAARRAVVRLDSGISLQPDLGLAGERRWPEYTSTCATASSSDGTPITAHGVKFSLERARAFAEGWSGPFYLSEIDLVEAIDDITVWIKLIHPSAYFLYQLTTAPAKISPSSRWTDLSVTSGAFTLKDLPGGFLLKLTQYWQPPSIDRVHIIFHASSDEALKAYEAGDVHVMGSLQTSVPDAGLTHSDLNKHDPSSGVRYLGFNHQDLPFNDTNVRQAFALA